MPSKVICSPNNNIQVEFIISGGFVPFQSGVLTSYHQIAFNQQLLANRYFTEQYLWSDNSTFFIIQEWLLEKQDIDHLNSALLKSNVKLTAFNTTNDTNGLIAVNFGGKIIPKQITNTRLKYQMENDGTVLDFEVDINAVKWEKNVYVIK